MSRADRGGGRALQRKRLVGSAWTALGPLPPGADERHFTVDEVRGEGAAAAAVLRALLTARRQLVSLAELRDPARWARGWLALPAEPGDDEPPR